MLFGMRNMVVVLTFALIGLMMIACGGPSETEIRASVQATLAKECSAATLHCRLEDHVYRGEGDLFNRRMKTAIWLSDIGEED
jgi:hypothetical protein